MNPNRCPKTPIQSKIKRIHTTIGFHLLADPGDALSILLLRDGIFEAPETELVTRIVRPQDTCVDAGCHLGYYTCLLAELVGRQGKVYSFDANPSACESSRRNIASNGLNGVEVTWAALGDRTDILKFHVSTNDQTGLSSLGCIRTCKEIISVQCLRLDEFLSGRNVESIRLLKLDVEGAEELVLKGLGRFLVDHLIDFILVECYDERLQLLNTSTENIAKLLGNAGYVGWEYGTQNASGWSRAAVVRSRSDCNYLFVSPSVRELLPKVSLAGALSLAQKHQRGLEQALELRRNEMASLRGELESRQKQTVHCSTETRIAGSGNESASRVTSKGINKR